jgi:hypothetical protein
MPPLAAQIEFWNFDVGLCPKKWVLSHFSLKLGRETVQTGVSRIAFSRESPCRLSGLRKGFFEKQSKRGKLRGKCDFSHDFARFFMSSHMLTV